MKHIIDKTRVAESVQKTALALIMFEISVWLDPIVRQTEGTTKLYRYIQQGTYALAFIFTVIAVLSLKKLIPKTLRRAIFDKFLFAMKKMASGIAGVSRKILGFFGIRFDRFKRGRDEKSFIFGEEDEDERRRKRHSIKSTSKWRDMNENADKIRFLYIKYIVKMIKGGYKFRNALTPNEVREDLDFDEEAPDGELFDLYNGARYSGGSVFITDEQVEYAQAVVNGKKK